jgi:hypothetical protein
LMESASLQRRVHKNEFRSVAKGGLNPDNARCGAG